MTEEEEAQKLHAELAEKEQQTEVEPEATTPEVETEPVEEETNMLPALATPVVLVDGTGAFGYMKLKEKKKAEEAAKPDPDFLWNRLKYSIGFAFFVIRLYNSIEQIGRKCKKYSMKLCWVKVKIVLIE